jgi:membrane-associated protease RseP (regulator of RpoE activity)
MDILTWANQNLSNFFTLLFYVGIFALVYFNKKRFEVQSGFIYLLRTKVGLRLIDSIGKKHRESIKILALIGIGIGFVGMIFISYTLISNLYNLLFVAGAQSAVAPALPGVKVPGSPIFIPLIIGWIALFVVTVVHEFSHGIVTTAHGLKVKSSGVAFFGPIMGAFVEPDEKKLLASSDVTQYSIYAAGPFSNILLTVVALLLVILVANPLISSMTVAEGFSFDGVSPGYPAAAAGVRPGLVFTSVNGISANNATALLEVMKTSQPGQVVTLATNESSFQITLAQYPAANKTTFLGQISNIFRKLAGKEVIQETEQAATGYLGVTGISTEYGLKQDNLLGKIGYNVLLKIAEFLYWIFVLSSGIGLVNLLPMGPIDGGRMVQVSLVKTKGKKKGMEWWKRLSVFFLIVLLLNVFLSVVAGLLPIILNLI